MSDDGREIGLGDFIGRNIKFRYMKDIQVFIRKNSYYPVKYQIAPAMQDIGEYSGIYTDSRNQKKVLELIQSGDSEDRKVFYIYFDDNNDADLDVEYLRKQYFEQETESNGWFNGALDGDISNIPANFAKKLSDMVGIKVENVKKGFKVVGGVIIASTFGLAYLYWKMHQTNVNINLNDR